VHHFSAGGLYNGLILLTDDETRSYWDHLTGEALHGPLAGRRLPVWSAPITTVAAALTRWPDATLSRSPGVGLKGRFMQWKHGRPHRGNFWLPPGFKRTMGALDARQALEAPGLAVIVDGDAAFFPLNTLAQPRSARVGDRDLTVAIDPLDHSPFAVDRDGERPFQVFTRWYGAAFTWPDLRLPEP